YVPRYIRQIRLHYQPNWPCTTSIQSTNVGEILHGWTMSETNDSSGGKWLLLSSPNPSNLFTSLRFADFGTLVTFTFKDALPSPSNTFSLFDVDNSIYAVPGSTNEFQSFVITNTGYVKAYL